MTAASTVIGLACGSALIWWSTKRRARQQARIKDAIAAGHVTVADITKASGLLWGTVATQLTVMELNGEVVGVGMTDGRGQRRRYAIRRQP